MMLRARLDVGRAERGQAMSTVMAAGSVAVVVVATLAFVFGAGSSGDDPDAASADAGESPTPSETPSAPQTTPDREQTQPDKKADQRDAKKQAKQRRKANSRWREVYVEVYNNSSVAGLAASASARLQDAGWQVVGIDNWRGNIPESTVYYPEQFEAEAKRLSGALGIDRLHGAVAPMKFDRLTVILTADYA